MICKSSSTLKICLLDCVYRLLGLMQRLLSSQDLYGNRSSWQHFTPLAHSVHQQIFVELDKLVLLLETPDHLGSSNTRHFLPASLDPSSQSLFFCQFLKWKLSLLLLPRLTSLLPRLTIIGTFSYSNYCLHDGVSQIHAICTPVSFLTVKLTWSTLC